MARKDRAPNPPRRVQAPQQRKTQRSTSGLGDRRLLIAVAAGAVVLALVVVLGAVFVAGGNGGDDARATLEDAGCTLQIVDSVTNASDHSDVPTVDTKVDWNTDPPSNGRHYGNTAVFGRYDEPLQQQFVVHNYEHGAVGIQYGSQVPEAAVQQLRDYYDDDPNGILLAPYPSLGEQIALTAWWDETPGEGDKGKGVVAKCPNFDEGAFDAFLDAYGFQGPEAFPRDALQPGSN